MPEQPELRIYLNDHLAGASLGLALARRSHAQNREGELGEFLATFVREVDEDRRALVGVMERLGARANPLKSAVAVAAERVGRLKLNGRVLSYSDLSRLLELEGLVMGVTGKRALWRSLRQLDGELPQLRAFDLDGLERRADAELAELEHHRVRAARVALAVANRRSPQPSAG